MNICFFAQFPLVWNEGGVQRISNILCREFEKDGHKVHFVTFNAVRSSGPNPKRQIYFNSTFENSSENVREFRNFLLANNIDMILNQAGSYSIINSFFENVIDSIPVKLITVHNNCIKCIFEKYQEILIFNSNNILIKYLVSNVFVFAFLKKRFFKKYQKNLLKAISLSDAFVVYFPEFIDELENVYSIKKSSKIRHIPNPLSYTIGSLDLKQKEKRIIYVGRLSVAQKRVDRLLKIWKVLHSKYPDWSFDIVGDGPARDYMEKYVKNNQLNRVIFHGFKDPKSYLERAKILTLTSDFEGFGMVLTEAQSLGVVPISFRCFSAINSVVDYNSGCIVEEFDIEKFILSTKNLIENENIYLSYQKNGLKNMKAFEPENIKGNWYKLFEDLT